MHNRQPALLHRVVISNCAAVSGGGFFRKQARELSLVEVTIADCAAEMAGGGGHVEGSLMQWLEMRSCVFLRCMAADQGNKISGGGALCLTHSGSVEISQTIIADCHAERFGGALFLSQGMMHLSLLEVNITNCSAPDGSAVYASLLTPDARVSASLVRVLPSCLSSNGPLISSSDHAVIGLPNFYLPSDGCVQTLDDLLGPNVRISNCEVSGGASPCGPAASCVSAPIAGFSLPLEVAYCQCSGDTYPNPSARTVSSAPYDWRYGEQLARCVASIPL